LIAAATRASRSLSTNSKGAESPDFDKLEALDEPRDAGELHDTVDVAVVGSEIQAANENVSAFDEVPDVPATAGSSSATDVHPNVAESPKPILTDRDVSPLADITNDMTMAHRTASVPPFVTPRHQRKTHFIYGATPPEVGIDQQSRSFSNTPISSDRAITPIKLPSTGILTMKEMGERAMAEHDVAIAEHVVLRNASQPNQSIRPAYLRALDERAAAALLAPPVPSPTPAYLRASPSPTLIAPREVLKRKAPTTEVLAATEETSRRVRRLTDFGVQHEKDMEAKKAKAAKASLKKAEHVKANEASAKGTKKTARGKKGRK
jgi:hypothetical protein